MKITREIKAPLYSQIIEFAIIGLIPFLLLGSFLIGIDTHELSSSIVSSSSSAAVFAKFPTVKIVSPHKGQQVPTNSTLLVSGTSSAPSSSKLNQLNQTASACKVSVLLNAVKPYQKAVATGYGGRNDYSSWQYTITPNYASINAAQNKITAKVTCAVDSGNNITKFSSVNVTGVIGGSPLVVNGQNGRNGTNGVSGSFFGGNNGNGGKDGTVGNTNGGNGGIAIGGQGGNGGNGGSGGSAIGGNGGNGGSGGSAIGGNGGTAIGGNGGNGGSGGND